MEMIDVSGYVAEEKLAISKVTIFWRQRSLILITNLLLLKAISYTTTC